MILKHHNCHDYGTTVLFEMTKMNVDILGISEIKWTEMGECN